MERIADCQSKTGPWGKVAHYKRWGVSVVFDDNKEILEEAFNNSMWVFPITTYHEAHQWYRDAGFIPYTSFAQAVCSFLEQQPRSTK